MYKIYQISHTVLYMHTHPIFEHACVHIFYCVQCMVKTGALLVELPPELEQINPLHTGLNQLFKQNLCDPSTAEVLSSLPAPFMPNL